MTTSEIKQQIRDVLQLLPEDGRYAIGWQAVLGHNLQENWGLDEKTLRPLFDDILNDLIEKEVVANADRKEKENDEAQVKNDKHNLAMMLCERHHIKTLDSKRDDARVVLIYRDGYYQPGYGFLRSEIQRIMDEKCTSHAMNEILRKMKDSTNTQREAFTVDPRYLNLANGVYDLREKKLLPHSPHFPFRFKLPVVYDPGARCELIKETLRTSLDEQYATVFEEWIGFALYRSYFLKKGLIMVGPRDTGKTTITKLLTDFFGEPNTSSVNLQDLSRNKFASSNLYERHINIYDDMSAEQINDVSTFKIAVGGGWLPAEEKFGDAWQFKNYAKLTFTCNTIPSVKEINDDAFFDRWIIIPCNEVVEKKNQDPFYAERLTQPRELSGLLNVAIEKLQHLLTSATFSYDKPPEEIKHDMMTSGDSVMAFVCDLLEESSNKDDYVTREEMHTTYQRYASAKGLPKLSPRSFSLRLPERAGYIDGAGKIDGGKTRVWRFVVIKWEVLSEFEDADRGEETSDEPAGETVADMPIGKIEAMFS